MAFVKRNVKDRVVQYPRRYQLVEVQSGIFDLVPIPGTITEPGTAINKAYLQPIEDELENISKMVCLGTVDEATGGFNTALKQGEYLINANANTAGNPTATWIWGKLVVKVSDGTTHNNSNNWIWQIAYLTTGDIYARHKENAGAWSSWVDFTVPKNHRRADGTYGLGTPAYFGHVAIRNDLTLSSYQDGQALSAYQGKVLNDLIDISSTTLLADISIASNIKTDISSYLNGEYEKYIFVLDTNNLVFATTGTSSTRGFGFMLQGSQASIDEEAGGSRMGMIVASINATKSPKTATIGSKKFIWELDRQGGSYYDPSTSANTHTYVGINARNNSLQQLYLPLKYPAYAGFYLQPSGDTSVSGTANLKIYGQNFKR